MVTSRTRIVFVKGISMDNRLRAYPETIQVAIMAMADTNIIIVNLFVKAITMYIFLAVHDFSAMNQMLKLVC